MKEITKEFVEASLHMSDNGQSKASERELELYSTSSRRLKSLLNNLCSKPNTRYLELGVYKGGSLLSAAFGNKGFEAVAVDNYSYDDREPKKYAPDGGIWDNMKSQLESNIARYADPDSGVNPASIKLVPKDWKTVNWNAEKRFDVCFFDINPVVKSDYVTFFETVFLALNEQATIVFSNYSNQQHAEDLEFVLESLDSFTVLSKEQRISGGLSDSTQYGSGVLVLTIQKNKTKGK
jgi:hypothetical protein